MCDPFHAAFDRRSVELQFDHTAREKLKDADGPWGQLDYTYDGVGNRLTRLLTVSGSTTTDTYSYPATSNLLQSVAGGQTRAFTYDGAGNVTYDARSGVGYGYSYDAANQMASMSLSGVVQAEYEYNALGQQVIRRLTQTGQTIHSVHDRDGNRIAEYDYDDVTGTSTLLREYIWMDGELTLYSENLHPQSTLSRSSANPRSPCRHWAGLRQSRYALSASAHR